MSKTTLELFKTCNSWSEAVQKSKGYEEKELISALLSNFTRNSPWVQKPSANLDSRLIELFAAFLYSLRFISPRRTPIRVADLGGGNGYMGYYISKLFPELHWVWNVYESSKVAAAYSSFRDFELPKNLELNFVSSSILFSEKEGDVALDLILISCALQYFEKPYNILEGIFKNNAPKIMMRIPFVDLDYDIPVVQDFEKLGGYAGAKSVSWPMWWFSRKKFLEFIAANDSINYQWVTDSESYRFMSRDIPLEGLVCGCR